MPTDADDNKARQTIRRIFEEKHYLIDTHTAVAMAVLNSYRQQTGVSTKTVVASTAHPFKFVRDVLLSLQDKASDDPFERAGTAVRLYRRTHPAADQRAQGRHPCGLRAYWKRQS